MATRMGKFKDEIVPVEVVKKAAGQEVAKETITQDESINPGLTVQKAALYPTVFKKDGTVTPANACPMNDGAAAMLVTTAEQGQGAGPASRWRASSATASPASARPTWASARPPRCPRRWPCARPE